MQSSIINLSMEKTELSPTFSFFSFIPKLFPSFRAMSSFQDKKSLHLVVTDLVETLGWEGGRGRVPIYIVVTDLVETLGREGGGQSSDLYSSDRSGRDSG